MDNNLVQVQKLVSELGEVKSLISDDFHTFEELYTFRKLYNALLFNEWGKNPVIKKEWYKSEYGRLRQRTISEEYLYDVHKSLRHHDGELCFGGGWFVVVAVLPSGQITNHYKIEDWELFKIPEVEKAKYEFDGHTSKDVIDRMLNLLK